MRGSDTYVHLAQVLLCLDSHFCYYVEGGLISLLFNCRCELVFENCFVPEENVLGQVGKGMSSELTSMLAQISCLIPLGKLKSFRR